VFDEYIKLLLLETKDLNKCVDFSVYTEFDGGTKMATLTLSVPGYEEAKKKFPEVNWNEVLKAGLLRRLEELKQFEALKNEGILGTKQIKELLRKSKKGGWS